MKNVLWSVKCVMIAAVLGLVSGIASLAEAKPLKVFILAGQSNMQGWIGVSTLDSLADDPKTAPILKDLCNADGKPRVCEKVWISSIGCAGEKEQKGQLTAGFGAGGSEWFGPEFPFGIYMEKLLGEPILIIKTSWGGKSLNTDFRSPSAGHYEFSKRALDWQKQHNENSKEKQDEHDKLDGVYYRLMIEHVRKVLADIKPVVPQYDSKQGYELAGFLWFQGWNDFCDEWTYPDRNQPGGYDLYSKLLADFIRDVRKDLSAPKMPFVIGVMGIGGVKEGPPMPSFRQAQVAVASLPEFKGSVAAVPTAQYWDYDLDELQKRWDKTAEEVNRKHPGMTQAEKDEEFKQAVAVNFTPEELKRYKGGVGHTWGVHYLGAAKIMAPSGKDFAEAMAKLQKTK